MRMKKHEKCIEWSWSGCESRIFEARPCRRGYICCGDCDLINRCEYCCGYIYEMIFE